MEALTRLSLRHPAATLFATAAVVLLAAAGLPRMTTEVGYRGILGDEHPSVLRLEAFIDHFGGGLPVFAVFSCAETAVCDSVFDPAALRMASAVAKKIGRHPLVQRVESPATSPLLVPGTDGFEVRRFVSEGALAEDREALAEIAVEDAQWRGTLVSDDGKVGALLVQLTSSDSRTTTSVVPALQEILATYENRGFSFYLVGDPVDFAVAGGELQKETPRIVPVMVLLIVVITYALFRTWSLTILALATTGVAVVVAMGTMAWLGWPQSELTQALAPSILVIGVCSSIHVLARYTGCLRATSSPSERADVLLGVAREVGPACFVAALTTAAGLLSFSTSGFASFLRFGVIAALGVILSLLLTFTLLPVFLVRVASDGGRAARVSGAWDRALIAILAITERRGAAILTGSALLMFVSGFGLAKLEVDVDERELLGSNSKVVHWAEFVREHLRRTDTLEIEITLPEGSSAASPDAIAAIVDTEAFLPSVEGLGRVRSFLDPLRRLNQLLHDDDPAYYRTADTRAGNAQLLWVLRLDAATDPNVWIGSAGRRVRFSVEADPVSKSQRLAILEQVESHLESRLPPDWQYRFTGPFSLYLDLVREMQRTQLRSFATAAAVVSLLFWLFLWAQSSRPLVAFRWMLLGMIPNGMPVLVTLGAMGLWGIKLDVGTIMVGAIVLGIAVDDTIHLITRYGTERARGASPQEAVSRSVRWVGRAVITTSIVLSLGFFALTLSSWQSIASFGLLSGIAILAALVADLFILPALILGIAPATIEPDRPGVTRALPVRGRKLLGLLVVLLLGGTLYVSATSFPGEGHGRLGCSLLPSGHVSLLGAGGSHCPLQPFDRVDLFEIEGRLLRTQSAHARLASGSVASGSVRARVQRDGSSSWVEMPVLDEPPSERALRIAIGALLATGLVGSALFLLAYSSAPAAAPYLALCSCLATVFLYAVRVGPPVLVWPYLLAGGFVPAAAAHFTLSFPHPGRLRLAVPGLARWIYAAGAVNAAIVVWGAVEYPTLLRGAVYFTASLTLLIWIGLLAKCSLARSEAGPGLERARAGAALSGSLALAVALAVAWLRWDGAGIGSLQSAALVFLPLPFGYALARYQLGDVRPYVRQLAGYSLVQLLFAGGLATLLFGFVILRIEREGFEPAAALGSLFLLVLLGAVLRDWGWRSLRARIPTVDARLQENAERHARRLSTLQDADRAALTTAETLDEALATSGVSIFVRADVGWRLATSVGGGSPLDPALAELAARQGRGGGPIHLCVEEGARGAWADRLRDANVEIAAPLAGSRELVGMALIAGAADGLPYTTRELSFAASVCAGAAVAIQNATLAEELLQAERMATAGQIATGLAHDLGKPINVLYQRALSVSRDGERSEHTRRHAAAMANLADEALSTLDHFVANASHNDRAPGGSAPLADVVERAVQAAEQLHGAGVVTVRLTPELPDVDAPRDLRQVLVNLLDNALLSGADAPVEIYAVRAGLGARIEVIDSGCGMDSAVLERALDPFFTTRSAHGGRGVGLAASRACVERLGGSLELTSRVGVGTRACLLIPASNGRGDSDAR